MPARGPGPGRYSPSVRTWCGAATSSATWPSSRRGEATRFHRRCGRPSSSPGSRSGCRCWRRGSGALVKPGAGAEDERRAVRALLAECSRVSVSDDEVAAYYREHPDEFHVPETLTLRQILVATSNEARDVRRRLQKDPKSFEAIARERLEGPGGGDGRPHGDLRPGPAPHRAGGRGLRPARGRALSEIVETSLGFHVLRVDERQAAREETLRRGRRRRIRALLERQKADRNVRQFVSGPHGPSQGESCSRHRSCSSFLASSSSPPSRPRRDPRAGGGQGERRHRHPLRLPGPPARGRPGGPGRPRQGRGLPAPEQRQDPPGGHRRAAAHPARRRPRHAACAPRCVAGDHRGHQEGEQPRDRRRAPGAAAPRGDDHGRPQALHRALDPCAARCCSARSSPRSRSPRRTPTPSTRRRRRTSPSPPP